MLSKDFLAQALGLMGMTISLFSFQQRTQKNIMRMQLASSLIFVAHFYLLGAYTGSFLNLIGAFRAFIFARRNTCAWAAHPAWLHIFSVLFLGVYVLNFTLWGLAPTPTNLLLQALPTLGMILTTIAFRMSEARKVRLLSLSSNPLWLIYNISNHSMGGILTESINLCSILVGMLRLDLRKTKKQPRVSG